MAFSHGYVVVFHAPKKVRLEPEDVRRLIWHIRLFQAASRLFATLDRQPQMVMQAVLDFQGAL